MSVVAIRMGRAVIGCLALLLAGSVSCTHSSVGNQAPLCGCLNPLDSLVDGRCLRLQSACYYPEDCAEGYNCTPEGKCVCRDFEVCGVVCSQDCSCPEHYLCDAELAFCRPSAFCLDDQMCEPTQRCRYDYHINSYICRTYTGHQVGDPCQEDDDCRSGICYTNVCLQTCRTNAGCPDGQVCSIVGDQVPACVAVPDCSDCVLETHFCDRWTCVQGCRTSGDCEGDCYVQIVFPLSGECVESSTTTCDADEFIVKVPLMEQKICVIYADCWYDTDCPADYRCYSSFELLGYHDDAAFCGRQL